MPNCQNASKQRIFQGDEAVSVEKLHCICFQPWSDEVSVLGVECIACLRWYHVECIGMTDEEYEQLNNDDNNIAWTIHQLHTRVCKTTSNSGWHDTRGTR